MNQDFSIVTLVLHASIVVQIVMAGLMIASLASWTVIFGKLFGLRRTKAANAALTGIGNTRRIILGKTIRFPMCLQVPN